MCEQTVLRFMRPLTAQGCSIAVAVSGGADSMALLGLFHALRERLGFARVGVIHIDHGLRGAESDSERLFVEATARRLGCPIHVKRLSGMSLDRAGLEEWARAERYRFFAEILAAEGYAFVATGHTADDQAETILLRLLRGTGITGLAGIRPIRQDGIIRPILGLKRVELERWLREHGFEWRTDSSNDEVRFRRNRVRHVLLPALSRGDAGVADALARCAPIMRNLRQALEPAVNKWIDACVIHEDSTRIILAKPIPRFPLREAIAALLRRRGLHLDRSHVLRMVDEFDRTSGEFLLPNGWRYYPRRGFVDLRAGDSCPVTFRGHVAARELPRPGDHLVVERLQRGEGEIRFDAANMAVFVDRESAGERLVCRRACPDDRFQPLGSTRSHVALRYMKKQGIEREARESMVVVVRPEGQVVWIPGLAVGHEFRITEATTGVLRISFRRAF